MCSLLKTAPILILIIPTMTCIIFTMFVKVSIR